MSTAFEIIASGGFGIAAGVVSGFLGIGGGAILPPLLVLVLGIEQHRAQGISLAALLPPVGLPAVLAYRRAGIFVSVKLVVMLVVGFVGGGLGGAWLAQRVPAAELRVVFSVFLVVTAVRAVLLSTGGEAPTHEDAPRSAWVGLLIGGLAGVVSGLLGLGGGLIALPLLRRFGRLGRLEAQATTLAMMLPPIGLPAVYVYSRGQGGLPWELLVAVAVGFALGAGGGARIAGRVDARTASIAYAVLVGVLALVLVFGS